MNLVPFVHEGLGNSSYLLPLGGDEALLVDPDEWWKEARALVRAPMSAQTHELAGMDLERASLHRRRVPVSRMSCSQTDGGALRSPWWTARLRSTPYLVS